jgi:putative acetyltransferase
MVFSTNILGSFKINSKMSVTIRKNKREDNEILAKIIRTSFHDFDVKATCGTVYTDPTTDDLFSISN